MTTTLDQLMRHQVYLEGFKAGASSIFRDIYLKTLDDDLRRLLAVVRVDRLDELTKAAMNALIAKLVGLLAKSFNRYASDILKFLRRFMDVERQILGKILPVDPIRAATPLYGPLASLSTRPGRDRLWTAIEHSALPGVGTYLGDTLSVFGTSASAKITNLVRASAANGQTVSETLGALVGDPTLLFGNALLTRFDFQNTVIIATIIQHIAQMVTAAVASSSEIGFTWASVLDSGTTDICNDRAGRFYLFADGPLPPAHYKCRSLIIPGRAQIPASFAAWLTTQPPELVVDMLSSRNAEDSLRNPYPLSLDDFLGKLDNITL